MDKRLTLVEPKTERSRRTLVMRPRQSFGCRSCILMEPTDFEYGERQYSAEHLAGHQWTFSETLADVAPEEWGGTSVTSA